MNYPISKELKKAIKTLYPDPAIGLGFLGIDESNEDWVEQPQNFLSPAEERSKLLRKKLEGYIVNMALESEEYEDKVHNFINIIGNNYFFISFGDINICERGDHYSLLSRCSQRSVFRRFWR